jgi:hypothetical protein
VAFEQLLAVKLESFLEHVSDLFVLFLDPFVHVDFQSRVVEIIFVKLVGVPVGDIRDRLDEPFVQHHLVL